LRSSLEKLSARGISLLVGGLVFSSDDAVLFIGFIGADQSNGVPRRVIVLSFAVLK